MLYCAHVRLPACSSPCRVSPLRSPSYSGLDLGPYEALFLPMLPPAPVAVAPPHGHAAGVQPMTDDSLAAAGRAIADIGVRHALQQAEGRDAGPATVPAPAAPAAVAEDPMGAAAIVRAHTEWADALLTAHRNRPTGCLAWLHHGLVFQAAAQVTCRTLCEPGGMVMAWLARTTVARWGREEPHLRRTHAVRFASHCCATADQQAACSIL